MNAAQRLYDQYQRQLKDLQTSCPHQKSTEWMEEWWAPGHSTGRQVKACTDCNLVIQSRRKCYRCMNWFPEGDLKQGDGGTFPVGGWLCEACRDKPPVKTATDE